RRHSSVVDGHESLVHAGSMAGFDLDSGVLIHPGRLGANVAAAARTVAVVGTGRLKPMRKRFWTVALLTALGSTVVSQAQSWDLWQAYASAVISPEGRGVDHQGGGCPTAEGHS